MSYERVVDTVKFSIQISPLPFSHSGKSAKVYPVNKNLFPYPPNANREGKTDNVSQMNGLSSLSHKMESSIWARSRHEVIK